MQLKDDEEEEVCGAVKREGGDEVVNDSCNNNGAERENQLPQEHGRPAMADDHGEGMVNQNRNRGTGNKQKVAWDEDSKQERVPCQDGGVAGDGACVSTEKIAVINPGAADTTSYALR